MARFSEKQNMYLAAIRVGADHMEAVRACGVERIVAMRWRLKSETFRKAIDEAENEYLDTLETVVRKAAVDDPKLALAILERRRPDTWGRETKVDVSGTALSTFNVAFVEATYDADAIEA